MNRQCSFSKKKFCWSNVQTNTQIHRQQNATPKHNMLCLPCIQTNVPYQLQPAPRKRVVLVQLTFFAMNTKKTSLLIQRAGPASQVDTHMHVPHPPCTVLTDQQCTPKCTSAWIGDGSCDTYCNNQACSFDGRDCQSSGHLYMHVHARMHARMRMHEHTCSAGASLATDVLRKQRTLL